MRETVSDKQWTRILNSKFRILYSIVLSFTLSGCFAQNIDKSYLLGQFEESKNSRFVKLSETYARGSAIDKFLRKETYEAFVKMAEAAKKDSVYLFIISATRNFEAQKKIWENKWEGRTLVEGKNLTTVADPKERARLILLYSSMPGTSRHHWGTDMDLNSLDNSYFEKGEGLKIYQWLVTHATEFGFCQPYTSKAKGRTGYEEERWHWSYLPLSGAFLKAYVSTVTYSDITNFKGSDSAQPVKAIENYVQGIGCN